MNRRSILLLINKGQLDQGSAVILMPVLGIVNAWTRMWSTVYLEYFVFDSTLEKSKGECKILFFEILDMSEAFWGKYYCREHRDMTINPIFTPFSNSTTLGITISALQTVIGGYGDSQVLKTKQEKGCRGNVLIRQASLLRPMVSDSPRSLCIN